MSCSLGARPGSIPGHIRGPDAGGLSEEEDSPLEASRRGGRLETPAGLQVGGTISFSFSVMVHTRVLVTDSTHASDTPMCSKTQDPPTRPVLLTHTCTQTYVGRSRLPNAGSTCKSSCLDLLLRAVLAAVGLRLQLLRIHLGLYLRHVELSFPYFLNSTAS